MQIMYKALTTVKPTKIIILIICFALTSIVIYRHPSSKAVKKQVQLNQALTDIKGWAVNGYTPLDSNIVKALELDNYVNQGYSNGSDTLFLYIGYYLTAKKVGAAHDPLVCFPGQGWVVTGRQKGRLSLHTNPGDSISYSSMIVQRGMQKELIIYWFQSYDRTNPDTLSQKIHSLWKKLRLQREDNAFVRVSMALEGKSPEDQQEIMFGFIREFYPVFLSYIRQGNKR